MDQHAVHQVDRFGGGVLARVDEVERPPRRGFGHHQRQLRLLGKPAQHVFPRQELKSELQTLLDRLADEVAVLDLREDLGQLLVALLKDPLKGRLALFFGGLGGRRELLFPLGQELGDLLALVGRQLQLLGHFRVGKLLEVRRLGSCLGRGSLGRWSVGRRWLGRWGFHRRGGDGFCRSGRRRSGPGRFRFRGWGFRGFLFDRLRFGGSGWCGSGLGRFRFRGWRFRGFLFDRLRFGRSGRCGSGLGRFRFRRWGFRGFLFDRLRFGRSGRRRSGLGRFRLGGRTRGCIRLGRLGGGRRFAGCGFLPQGNARGHQAGHWHKDGQGRKTLGKSSTEEHGST